MFPRDFETVSPRQNVQGVQPRSFTGSPTGGYGAHTSTRNWENRWTTPMFRGVLDATLCFRHRDRRSLAARRVCSGEAARGPLRRAAPLAPAPAARGGSGCGAGRGSRRRRSLPRVQPAKTWKDLITLEGLVDSYYQYYLNPPAGPNNSLTQLGGRQFDVNSNTFTLNYAKVAVGMTSDKAGFRIDMGYGATGAIVNSANPAGRCPRRGRRLPSRLPRAAGLRDVDAHHQPHDRLR